MMDLDLLKPGQTVANYKLLCNLIREPVKTGNAKLAQLKNWELYFRFERDKNSFIIKEILTQVDEIKLLEKLPHNTLAETLLLNYFREAIGLHFSAIDTSLDMQPVELVVLRKAFGEILGLVNQRFNSGRAKEYEQYLKDETLDAIQKRELNLKFFAQVRAKNWEIITYLLSSMQRRKLLVYQHGYTVTYLSGKTTVLSHVEAEEIQKLYQFCFAKFGVESLQELFLKRQLKAFYTVLNEELRDKKAITFHENCIIFAISPYTILTVLNSRLKRIETLNNVYKRSNTVNVEKLENFYSKLAKAFEAMKATDWGDLKTEIYDDLPDTYLADRLANLKAYVALD